MDFFSFIDSIISRSSSDALTMSAVLGIILVAFLSKIIFSWKDSKAFFKDIFSKKKNTCMIGSISEMNKEIHTAVIGIRDDIEQLSAKIDKVLSTNDSTGVITSEITKTYLQILFAEKFPSELSKVIEGCINHKYDVQYSMYLVTKRLEELRKTYLEQLVGVLDIKFPDLNQLEKLLPGLLADSDYHTIKEFIYDFFGSLVI